MQAPLAQVQVWTNLQCASGVPKAFIQHVVGATASLRLRGDSRVTIDLPLDDAAIAEVTSGRVLRLLYADGTYDEWRIDRLTTEAGPNGEVRRCQCAAPLFELGAVGPVTEFDSLGVPSFSGARYAITPSDLISTVILPWLTAQGVSWVSAGTITPTATVDIEWDTVTPLGLLHQLEEATQCELALRRNGTTGYLIDLVTAVNASQPVADLREGKNLTSVSLTEDATQRYSALTALGAADPVGRRAVLGGAVWEVSARNTTTDTLTLVDPEGGDDPILEDDQLNGLYVYLLRTGTTHQILDTSSSAQTVTLADASSYVVGDLIEIRASAGTGTYKDDAQRLTTLTRPSVTPVRVGQLDRPDLAGERNLLRNGHFTDWTNGPDFAPDGWTLHTGALDRDLRDSTYAELGPYALQLRFAGFQASATPMTSGATQITGINGSYFYVGQTVSVYGLGGAVETKTVTATAATTVDFTPATGYSHTTNSYIVASGATYPISTAALSQGWPGVYSDLVRAPVSGGSVFWAQAKIMLLGLTAGQYRGVLTVERYNASNILISSVVSETTVMDQWVTLGASVQVASGESLRLRIEVKNDPTYPGTVITWNNAYTARLLVDGACITQTDYQPANIPNYSLANALWQATNRALQQSAGTSYEVQLVDLTALDASGWPNDELFLGGTVRVNEHRTGISTSSLRIVELARPNLFEPARCTVVLNQRRLDLTEIIDRALGTATANTAPPAPGGSGQPIGSPATTALVPVKVPFHANGDASSPDTLALGAHASGVTEVDTGMRCFVDFTNCVKCRVETVVSTVGHTTAKIAVQYSTDSGSTWAYLDGTDDPSVAITATGLVAGTEIAPIPGGEAWVRLVMLGGNSATSPVLRNTFLALWYSVLASPVPRPSAPVSSPTVSMCGLSPDAVQGDAFNGSLGQTNWSSASDFVSNAGAPTYNTGVFGTATTDVNFDTTDLVAGHRTLTLTYQDSANTGQFWNTRLANSSGTATEYDDVWYRIALKIPSAFTSIPTPAASPAKAGGEPGDHAYGFILLQFSPFDSGTNLSAWRDISFWLSIKGDGRLYVESLWYEHPTLHWGQTDIGAASLLADGAWHDLILRVRRKPGDDTSVRLSVYIGDVCETGLSATATVDLGPHADLLNSVGRSVTGGWGFIQVPGFIDTNGSAFGPHDVKVGRHEVVPTAHNANPFLTT